MLISPRHLLDRLRHPRSRADDLARLRARFAAQPTAGQATPRQLELARELRELRSALSAALADVASCHSCARGHGLPHGRWDGGHCCGTHTLNVYSPQEVAALKLSGSRAESFEPPRSDHAGCVFRGPSGCSLDAADRPNVCVRYVCPTLREELRARPDWPRIKELRKRLAGAFDELTASLEQADSDRYFSSAFR